MRLFVALAIFEGCPRAWLDDADAQRAVLEAAVAAGRFTLLEIVVRRFEPQGVTACAIVGESHLALHTWPEEGQLFVDVASCSTEDSVTLAVRAIEEALPTGMLAVVERRVLEGPRGTRR